MSDNQLRTSPLRLELHEFLAIDLSASEAVNPEGPHQLQTQREFEAHNEDPLQYKVILRVNITPEDEKEPCPYKGSIAVVGYFSIAAAYPEEKRSDLIKVTGSSMLYGACREMIANFTARSRHGILSIPSISFVPPEARKAVKKKSAKKKLSTKSAKKRARK